MPSLRRLTGRLWRAAAALLLAVVLAHAVTPMQQDHARARGSAFSASTQEVSLRASTPAVVTKELLKFEPAPPRAAIALGPIRSEPTRGAVFTHQAGPGAVDPALHPLSPRAPPLA